MSHLIYALFLSLTIGVNCWPTGGDDRITIPCNQHTYVRGDKPDCFYQYANNPEYTACMNCAKCRAFCKEGLNYRFGDCAWDPLPATEPHLSRLACGDLYKCICSNTTKSRQVSCRNCDSYCVGDDDQAFVNGTCSESNYNCQCQYVPPLRPAHDRYVILDEHNSLRSDLANGRVSVPGGKLPRAFVMARVDWDTSLELLARKWVTACDIGLAQQEAPQLGVNSYAAPEILPGTCVSVFPRSRQRQTACSPVDTLKDAIAFWWGRKSFYNKNKFPQLLPQETLANAMIFTQMAWYEVSRIGCAVHYCFRDDKTKVFCVYNKSVMKGESSLYAEGAPCGGCQQNCQRTPATQSGLCVVT